MASYPDFRDAEDQQTPDQADPAGTPESADPDSTEAGRPDDANPGTGDTDDA